MRRYLLKYTFFFKVFFLLVLGLNAENWEWKNPLPQGNRINDLFAFSNSEAIAVGASGLIMKTTNGGADWSISKLATSEWLYAVHFADANNGYIAHGDGNVSKTVDAGATWTLVTKPNNSAVYDIWAKSATEVLCLDYGGKIFRSTDSGSTWVEIANPGSGSTYLNDIYFFDSNLGFIVGGNTSYSRSEIFKTTDGGETWSLISSPVESALTSVTFVDSNTGFIVGEGGAILKTVDAGETWSLYSNSGASYSEYTSGAIYTKFSTVSFFDQNNGLAAGEARIYFTADGGSTWTEGYYGYGDNSQTVYISGTSSAIALGDNGLLLSTANKGQTWAKDFDYNTESFYGLSFKGSVGYATATGGKVLKSTDNGETWTYLTQSGDYKSALTISDQNAIIAGTSVYVSNDGGSSWTYKSIDGSGSIWGLFSPKNSNIVYGVGSNRVIKSTDSGANWANLTSPYASTLYDVCFVDDNTGVAVGGKSGETKIYRTTDGASSWQEITSPVTNGALYGIDFIDETTGFACGTDTTLLKTTDGGVTWSKVILNSDLPSYSDDLRKVRFGDESNGVAVGVTGIVFITTDGGVTWTIDNNVPTQNFFYSCDYSTSKLVVAGSSGTILAKNVTLQNATIPTLTTTAVTNITQTTASSGGAITDDGGADITAKGVVWSTSTSPTLDANNGFTSNGTGTTEFNSDLTGLTAGTTYYVRAYATNSAGTGYGNEVQFTTEEESTVDPLSLPFAENFDGEVHDWTIKDLDGDENKWGIYTNSDEVEVAYSGTKCAGVKYNSNGCNDWLITPLLSLPAGEEIEFSLWAKSQDPSYLESFDIQISTDGGENFTKVGSQTDISATYTKYTYDLSDYAGQNVYIAIVCVSVDRFYLYVDDISCAIKGTTSSPIIYSESYLKAYPNPFTSNLTLESEKGISQVVVMNVSGQVVLAKQANGQSKLVLEANNLDTGLYIVKLTEVDGTILHTRIVKR